MPGTYREAWASVTRNRNLRLAQLSSVSAWTGEFLFLTAMTVYAFDTDGAVGVGLIGFLRVLPATIALPWLGALADRVSRHHLLVATCALRALTAAGAGVAAAAGLPALVYVLLTVSTVCHAAYRPVLGALFPTLCLTPDELAGVNAVRSVLDGLAALVGPLAAAALLSASSAAVAFGAVAVLAGIAGLLAAGLRYEAVRPGAPAGRTGVVADVVEGFRELRRRGRATEVIVLGGVQCVVRGALTVLAVVVAVDLTDLGRPGVGILWAAFGLGGLVAAVASIGAAGSARLGTLFGVGVALWGVPLVVLGLVAGSWVAVGAFLVIGAANALVDVTGFTLLQRLVPDQTLARVLALTEAVFSLALAVGSLAVPLLLAALGDQGALAVTGVVLPLAVAAGWAGLRSIDADIGVRTDRIVLLRRVRMLRLLPVPAIEGLAQRLRPSPVAAGADVFREGDPGDDFYVIRSGRVAVLDDGQEIRRLGPGDAFGEIALLRAVPRTATVRALEDTELAALSGPDFVSAVTGYSATSSTAEQLVTGYLTEDGQRHAAPPRTDPDSAPGAR